MRASPSSASLWRSWRRRGAAAPAVSVALTFDFRVGVNCGIRALDFPINVTAIVHTEDGSAFTLYSFVSVHSEGRPSFNVQGNANFPSLVPRQIVNSPFTVQNVAVIPRTF